MLIASHLQGVNKDSSRLSAHFLST
jgi:hypothetical protein